MARIKWIQHPTNPKLNGTSEHVSKATADYAVTVHQASHYPFADFRERLAAESTGGPDQVNIPLSWGIDAADTCNPHSQPRIIRREGRDTTWYSSPPPGCPLSIREEFLRLTTS